MADCSQAPTSMTQQIDQNVLETDGFDSTTYRQTIESLIYLMICSNPDIAMAVDRWSQFVGKPTTGLWACVKKSILIYKRVN